VIAAALAVARARGVPARGPPEFVRLPIAGVPATGRRAPTAGRRAVRGGHDGIPAPDALPAAVVAANEILAKLGALGWKEQLRTMYGQLYGPGGQLHGSDSEVGGSVVNGRAIVETFGADGVAPPARMLPINFHTHPPRSGPMPVNLLDGPSGWDVLNCILRSHAVAPKTMVVVADRATWEIHAGEQWQVRFKELADDEVDMPLGVMSYVQLIVVLAAYGLAPFTTRDVAEHAALYGKLVQQVSWRAAAAAMERIDPLTMADEFRQQGLAKIADKIRTRRDILDPIRKVDGMRLCRIVCERTPDCPATFEYSPGYSPGFAKAIADIFSEPPPPPSAVTNTATGGSAAHPSTRVLEELRRRGFA
jgi:hypothetical protein